MDKPNDFVRSSDGEAWRRACDAMILNVIRDVCELPDRTSPEGQPEMLLVTAAELQAILIKHLGCE